MRIGSANSILTSLIISLMLICISSAASLRISDVYLNNTANPGHVLLPGQQQAQAVWTFNASFSSTGQGINATLPLGSINYTDSQGRYITAAYPLRIYGNASSQKTSYYPINTAMLTPIQTMSSYVTVGSVYQRSAFSQSATAAAACNKTGLYSEWDFFVHVQLNYSSGARNVVVGRVCIYNQTIGWAEVLPKAPSERAFANITLSANGQLETIEIPDNSSPGVSSDRLAKAWWIGRAGIALVGAAAPNGTEYAALNDSATGQWYLQNAPTYMRWYTQYYRFTRSKIPHLNEQYSPTSIGILSNNCNVVSVTDLTNRSIYNAVKCMNSTANLYYSIANGQAKRIMASVQNLSGYRYAITKFNGKPAIAINLPAQFIPNPRIRFSLNGQFLGYALPAGAPQILMANSTPVTISGIGTITMLVENYGTSQGLFTVSINGCPGVFAESGVSYTIGAGQVINVTTAFSAPNTNLTLNEQCTVQVKGENGGGNAKAVQIVSETPNQYLHGALQEVQNAACDSDGVFTQLFCRYLGVGYS